MYIETTHNKDELELIVELVFKTQGLVGEGVVPTSLLQRHKQGCHVNMGSTHTYAHAAAVVMSSQRFHSTSLETNYTTIKKQQQPIQRERNSRFNAI